jgi:transposase
MSKKLNSEIAAIGIDIGKKLVRQGALVLRQKWSRGQVEARLANLPPCLIGIGGPQFMSIYGPGQSSRRISF